MNNFQRDISINISRQGHNIIAKSVLKDQFHDVCLQVCVDFDSLTIQDVELVFHKSPVEHCKEMETKLSGLVGYNVGKGITGRVFDLTSGSEGCINVRNMLLASLPLVINLRAGSDIDDREQLMDAMATKLQGTCIGHRA